jgi:hypothetical protein
MAAGGTPIVAMRASVRWHASLWGKGEIMRRLLVLVAAVAAVLALSTSPAGAYGGGANHDMWQVGISFNCNNPSICDDLGGFWGWAEFDRSADGTQTWGDAEFAFCFHTIGGGGAGAGHTSFEIESWTIEPGSAGPQTFFASGEETDTGHGTPVTTDFTHEDTGIPATPGHYNTSDIFGFTAPGVAAQIQVAFRPAK